MLNDLGWRDLCQRRVDSRLCMAYKVVHGLVAIPVGHFIKVQRDGVHLQQIYAKQNYYLYSFFPVLSQTGTNYLETLFRQNLWQSLKIGLPPSNMQCHSNTYLFDSVLISHSTNSFILCLSSLTLFLPISFSSSAHRTQPISIYIYGRLF